jgi:C4-dicarboxylate-specific signal transduction histidine kinase
MATGVTQVLTQRANGDGATIGQHWKKKEVERAHRARDARLAAERERYNKRLKTLTWEQLLNEQRFSRWNVHPPFPPPAFVAAARDRIHSTILELQALGPKPTKAQVRAKLKACVEWFNVKDVEFGQVIETEEREDICEVLGELAFVARHRSLVNEIDDWRTW